MRKFIKFMDGLKYSKRALFWLMALDAALAIASVKVDYDWLIRVPTNLVLFAPICSLYPLLLFVWFGLRYFNFKIPTWFTIFIFMGIFSYGLMSYIYFPLYMTWTGINFHDVGSIFWVTAYAIQAFIIFSEIKKIPWYQYLLIFGYFFFKDYSDRYLGTFLDIGLDNYPEYLKVTFTVSILTLHIAAAALILYFGFAQSTKNSAILQPQKQE